MSTCKYIFTRMSTSRPHVITRLGTINLHFSLPVQNMTAYKWDNLVNECKECTFEYGTRMKKVNVLRAYYTYDYGRTTFMATGVLRLWLQAYDA